MKNKSINMSIIFCAFILFAAPLLNAQSRDQIRLKGRPFFTTREEPDRNAFPAGNITEGKDYQIFSRQAGWYQVKADDGSMGWVPEALVEIISQGIHRPEQASGRIRITEPFIHIKRSPELRSENIGMAARGDQMAVISESGGWYKVRYENIEGWIPSAAAETAGMTTEQSLRLDELRQSAQSGGRTQRRSGPGFSAYARWVFIGAGAVTGALAFNYYQQGNSTFSDYESAATTPDAVRLYDETISYDKKKDTMFIAAGVNAGLGILFHILNSRSKRQPFRMSMNTNYASDKVVLGLNIDL